jgi:hypothetical protein
MKINAKDYQSRRNIILYHQGRFDAKYIEKTIPWDPGHLFMRTFNNIILLMLMSAAVSCNNSSHHTETKAPDTTIKPQKEETRGGLEFLRDDADKYPADVKLLENPVFSKRLKALTGDRYQFLKETWAVEVPIEVKDDVFAAKACMAHNCGSTNFIVVVNLASDKMYAGIREDDKVKLYGEDENHPAALKDWEKNN